MISDFILKSAEQASRYYTEMGDDFYTAGDALCGKSSMWYGKGAAKLKLEGEVEKDDFDNLLAGKLPNGVDLSHNKKSGKTTHRPGFDLTFSPDKSWSVAKAATLGQEGNSLFDELLAQAVIKTLEIIEQDLAMASKMIDGKQQPEMTKNIVAALFLHGLSRELDPQSHIHAVILNATEREDGKWRALKSDSPKIKRHAWSHGFIERFHMRAKDYDAFFKAYHGYLAQQHGFKLEFDENGNWRLKDIPKEICDFFSTRSEQIKADMEANAVSGAKAAQVSALKDRATKDKQVTKEAVEAKWKQQFEERGFAITLEALRTEQLVGNETLADERVKKALDYAVAHLSEKKSRFTEVELAFVAMREYRLSFSAEEVLFELKAREKDGSLVALTTEQGDRIYASSKVLRHEENLIKIFESISDSKSTQITPQRVLKRITGPEFAKKGFDTKHIELHKRLIADNALITIVSCNLKSNSHQFARELHALANSSKQSLVVLTARALEAEGFRASGMRAQTVSGFLQQCQKEASIARSSKKHYDLSHTSFVVMNTEKLSLAQAEGLAKIQKNYHARSFHLIDNHATESLAPGSLASLLRTHLLQHNLESSVDRYIKAENVGKTVEACTHERLAQMSERAAHAIYEGKSALIVAQNTVRVKALNEAVQEKLLMAGLIQAKRIQSTHYGSVYRTDTAKTQAHNYNPGEIVRFNKTYKSIGVKAGEYYRVESSSKESNLVSLQSVNQKGEPQFYWNPEKVGGKRGGAVSLFKEEEHHYHYGDKLVVSSASSGFKTGLGLTLVKSTRHHHHFQEQGGKRHKVAHNSPLLHHLSLGYAKTPQQALFDKPDIIYSEQLTNRRLTNPKALYQSYANARVELHLYTDNERGFNKTLEKYQGSEENITRSLLERITTDDKELSVVSQADQESRVSDTITEAKEKKLGRAAHFSALFKEKGTQNISQKQLVNKLTRYSVNCLNTGEAVLSRFDIRNHVVQESQKLGLAANVSWIDKTIDDLVRSHKLIPCRGCHETAFTTPYALRLELSVLKQAEARVNSKAPMLSSHEANTALNQWQDENLTLTKPQAFAVKSILTTRNQLILVNGLAGVGKTTLLQALDSIARDNNQHVVAFAAPTHKAVQEITNIGLEGTTLDSYIAKLSRQRESGEFKSKERVIVAIDESSMVSTVKFAKLLKLTENSNHSFAWIGDVKQIASIERGKDFGFLQKIGTETVPVDEIVRQKDNPKLLDLVYKCYQGKFKEVVESLHNRGHVTTHKDILAEYPELEEDSKDQLQKGLIEKTAELIKRKQLDKGSVIAITPANKNRVAINGHFRAKHFGQEQLSGQVDATLLANRDLDDEEKVHAKNYVDNQVILFNKTLPDLNIKNGEYYRVASKDLENNYLSLMDKEGKLLPFNVSSLKGQEGSLRVFEEGERGLIAGDTIRWRHTDKSKSRVNMDEAHVISVNDEKAELKLSNGKRQTLHLNEPSEQHWDHAYASTANTAQGATATHSIAYFESYDHKLTTQESFLVALTRAKKSFTLVTDDREELVKQLELGLGKKTSALEALGLLDKHKQQQKDNLDCYLDSLNSLENSQALHKESDAFSVYEAMMPQGFESEINETALYGEWEKSETQETVQTKNSVSHNPKEKTGLEKKYRYDAKEVDAALRYDIEKVATHLLGEPRKRCGSSLKFGSNKGSLNVTVRGKSQGFWYDFSTGEGGSPLDLIQQELGVDFKEALEYGAKLTSSIPKEVIAKAKGEQVKVAREVDPKSAATYPYALQIFNESRVIHGTLAEKYLRDIRGIDATHWPKDIRYHDGVRSGVNKETLPALVVVARDHKGEFQAIQCIYLDRKTAEKRTELPVDKQTFGSTQRALLNVSPTTSDAKIAVVAEGPEDALSLKEAFPDRQIYASLGKDNLSSSRIIQKAEHIILALDNDGEKPHEMARVMKAAERANEANAKVWLAQPEVYKRDYNTMLKDNFETGKDEIRSTVDRANSLEDVKNQSYQAEQCFNKHRVQEVKERLSNSLVHQVPAVNKDAIEAIKASKAIQSSELELY